MVEQQTKNLYMWSSSPTLFLGDMEPFGRGSYYFCEGRKGQCAIEF